MIKSIEFPVELFPLIVNNFDAITLYKFQSVSKLWLKLCTEILQSKLLHVHNRGLLDNFDPSDFNKKHSKGTQCRPNESVIKIVVLGAGGVGKSSTVVQRIQGIFIEKYDPTIEDSYRYLFRKNDKEETMLEILDTAGTEPFTAMRDLYMKNGDAFLVLFSIISQATFNDIPDYIDPIERVKDQESKDIPLIIIGNKRDLEEQRVITTKQAHDYALKLGYPYMESSAKIFQDTVDIFDALICELILKRKYNTSRNKSHVKDKSDSRRCLLQ